ncbi:MAG: ribose transport system ATP-binding protein [Solirubrobacteraceae bacterium]|nr:ribose transport system ATP-binding protein [Solirubrobacteraceae bacterium]
MSSPTITPATGDSAAVAPLISMEGVHVAFGPTVAVADETFRVRPGEIVGLLGHNGAGKSTLVNVATGAVRPQRGTMTLDGVDVPLRGEPRAVERLGIKVIHQEPALAANLSIADNITLGHDDERLPRKRRRQIARDALALLGSELNPDRPVGTLAFGERQIVDLARALSTNLKVLFLDEPTGALGRHETEELHAILRKLAGEGRAIVYISHRLRDIVDVCTRIVAMREGRIVLDEPAQGFTVPALSEALAPGVTVGDDRRAAAAEAADEVLDVDWHGQRIGFSRGEIVGLYGMAAGPQFRLLHALFGLDERVEARLEGTPFSPRAPRDAIARGVYLVSADRERDGLVPDMSALDNLIMPWLQRFTRYGALSRGKTAGVYTEAKEALDVRGAPMDAPVSAFSGGNKQKFVLGRWLYGRRPSVLLLSQPTQGVDVGARLDIARALRKLADDGVTVVVASSETDEIGLLCDRAVVCEGDEWVLQPREDGWEERLLEGLIARVGT